MYASVYNGGTLLRVWVQPKAPKNKIVGVHGDSIKIAVKAPPVEGKANEECIEYLSDILGLPKRQLAIKSGQQGRHKGVHIKGMTPEKVVASLKNAIEKA